MSLATTHYERRIFHHINTVDTMGIIHDRDMRQAGHDFPGPSCLVPGTDGYGSRPGIFSLLGYE